jgi:hypothetical protein
MFKKVTVVMLPTNEKASSLILRQDGKLFFNGYGREMGKEHGLINDIPQHLYFLSDEQIKEGDYAYYPSLNEVLKVDKAEVYEKGKQLKVVATIDKSLKVRTSRDEKIVNPGIYEKSAPQPSQSFIEKYVEEYNKRNIITEVMVEYEPIGAYANPKYESDYQLKINSKDNTITIKKVKDSWTREEVIELINSFYDHSYGGISESTKDKFIDENL